MQAKIVAYHRPASVDEALALLARTGVTSALVAGGTQAVPHLRSLPTADQPDEIIDLQALPLTDLTAGDGEARAGALVTLHALAECEALPGTIRDAARRAGPNTLRHAATLGGTLAAGEATSELLAALLVYEADVIITDAEGKRTPALADFLADPDRMRGSGLITGARWRTDGRSAAARVARTPADDPIVAAVARRTEDGGTRLAFCGVAATPILVRPEDIDAQIDPPSDFRGSSEYRSAMANILAARVMEELAIV
ncbi:MAG: FAD binding domain-containing protein [Caldilineaceae bacterium]|nr:FAD binding domain-containing protein [Caldilineaceae bacterium]